MNAAFNNPHSLSSHYQRIDCGAYFVLECVGTNSLFQLVGIDSRTAGIAKGWQIPLHALRAAYGGCALHAICGWCDSGFPIGVKAPFGTRLYGIKSSVLDLLRPWAVQRGCSVGEQAL